MSSRLFWGWFKHRLEGARCGGGDVLNPDLNSNNDHHINTLHYHSDIFKRTWGGVPIVYSFGDCHQLPPVGMEVISNISTRPKLNTSDFHGFLAFSDFLDSCEDGTSSYSIMMYEIIRQDDPKFKSVLHNLREATMDDRSSGFFAKVMYW